MKSKTVASILRHVASKLPSIDVDSTHTPTAVADASAPASVAPVSAVEPGEKETKKARRAAKQAAAHDDEAVAEDGGAVGTGPNEEERLEMLYDTIGWPLGKKYGHPYDAFKLALTCVYLCNVQGLNDLHSIDTSLSL